MINAEEVKKWIDEVHSKNPLYAVEMQMILELKEVYKEYALKNASSDTLVYNSNLEFIDNFVKSRLYAKHNNIKGKAFVANELFTDETRKAMSLGLTIDEQCFKALEICGHLGIEIPTPIFTELKGIDKEVKTILKNETYMNENYSEKEESLFILREVKNNSLNFKDEEEEEKARQLVKIAVKSYRYLERNFGLKDKDYVDKVTYMATSVMKFAVCKCENSDLSKEKSIREMNATEIELYKDSMYDKRILVVGSSDDFDMLRMLDYLFNGKYYRSLDTYDDLVHDEKERGIQYGINRYEEIVELTSEEHLSKIGNILDREIQFKKEGEQSKEKEINARTIGIIKKISKINAETEYEKIAVKIAKSCIKYKNFALSPKQATLIMNVYRQKFDKSSESIKTDDEADKMLKDISEIAARNVEIPSIVASITEQYKTKGFISAKQKDVLIGFINKNSGSSSSDIKPDTNLSSMLGSLGMINEEKGDSTDGLKQSNRTVRNREDDSGWLI